MKCQCYPNLVFVVVAVPGEMLVVLSVTENVNSAHLTIVQSNNISSVFRGYIVISGKTYSQSFGMRYFFLWKTCCIDTENIDFCFCLLHGSNKFC